MKLVHVVFAVAIVVGSDLSASAEPCHCADLAEPKGVIDNADLQAFVAMMDSGDAAADYAEPFGSVDFFDLLAFLELTETEPLQPNILWLTFEDTSWYALPAYGQDAISTPNIDAGIFAEGIRFDRAWSTAPACSPARSTLISGSYATTYGSDYHRRSVNVPADEYFFPRLLRDAGYYTTNNAKTDYNSLQPANAWDRNGNTASWTSGERNGRPFFSVFNSGHTHTVRVRSWHTDGRRDFTAKGIVPTLPPHVPNLPEVYSDLQFHLEGMLGIDYWVGRHLSRLEQEGLDDETIVFFFSDHGGLLPRGKEYVFETGLRVPFGVRVPPRLRCLVPSSLRASIGGGSDRLVGFVDFASTVLNIAGVEVPDTMQGMSFLGQEPGPDRSYQFGFTTNASWHFAPDRTVTDGRFKYIRRFIPHRYHGNRSNYQWGMPAWIAWDAYVYEGTDQAAQWLSPYTPNSPSTKVEGLFDIHADPFELNDLSNDPAHAAKLAELRQELRDHMYETRDLGLFPDSMRSIAGDTPMHTWVRDTGYDVHRLIDAAWLASDPTPADILILRAFLIQNDDALRFWGAIGFASLAATGQIDASALPSQLASTSSDANSQLAAAAVEARVIAGLNPPELATLVNEMLNDGNGYAYSALEMLTRFDTARPAMLAVAQPIIAAARNSWWPRAVAINLGLYPAADLFENYAAGLAVNQDILPVGPLP